MELLLFFFYCYRHSLLSGAVNWYLAAYRLSHVDDTVCTCKYMYGHSLNELVNAGIKFINLLDSIFIPC